MVLGYLFISYTIRTLALLCIVYIFWKLATGDWIAYVPVEEDLEDDEY